MSDDSSVLLIKQDDTDDVDSASPPLIDGENHDLPNVHDGKTVSRTSMQKSLSTPRPRAFASSSPSSSSDSHTDENDNGTPSIGSRPNEDATSASQRDQQQQEQQQPKQQQSLFYEQLGASLLLHRNHETYTALDEDAALCNTFPVAAQQCRSNNHTAAAAPRFVRQQSELYRAQTRWYYPVDAHVLQHAVVGGGAAEDPRVRQFLYPERRPSKRKKNKKKNLLYGKPPDASSTVASVEREEASLDTTGEPLVPSQVVGTESQQPRPAATAAAAQSRSTTTLLQTFVDRDEDETRSASGDESNASGPIENMDAVVAGLKDLAQQFENDDKTRSEGNDDSDADNDNLMTGEDTNKSTRLTLTERNAVVRDAFCQQQNYYPRRVLQLQFETRARMLLAEYFQSPPPNEERPIPPSACRRVHQRLRRYAQLDASYVPSRENSTASTRSIRGSSYRQTEMYDRERLNRASPAYMAPFHLPSLKQTTWEDMESRGIPHKRKRLTKEISAIHRDDPNAPTLFGNCLLSFSCQCGVCAAVRKADDPQPVTCLLHPVGALQDRVRLSFLSLPRGRRSHLHSQPRINISEELDTGYRIRQLAQCGRDPVVIVARTSVSVVVFSVTFVKPKTHEPVNDGECWGTANLELWHLIDQRTLWRHQPSYRPIDVACHPRYGVGSFAPCKIAILYQSDVGERNIIHHVQMFRDSLTFQKYTITNLQSINEIEFACHNPMILWAVARSYVRPALTSSYTHRVQKRPRVGHGYSLYSIDLRVEGNGSAVFQWSPSAEEFVPENIHSISGICTDWNKPHCLWVASTSAGKTWELDTRMPCQVMNSWSLPHLCDQTSAVLSTTGLYGSGTLFAFPQSLSGGHDTLLPVLSVGKNPGTFGVHLYFRPLVAPRFHTQSIECCAAPALSALGKMSVAASSTFALPDVSDRVFTCGLSVFQSPWWHFLDAGGGPHSDVLGFHQGDVGGVLCVLTLTSKGDIYAHNLLESQASLCRSKIFDGLPVGCSMIPVPKKNATNNLNFSWNCLRIALQNDFPVPSHGVLPLFNVPERAGKTIDILPIVEIEKATLKKHVVNANKRRRKHLAGEVQHNGELNTAASTDGVRTSWDDAQHRQQSGSREGVKTTLFANVLERGLGAVTIATGHSESGSLRLPSHLMPPSDGRELEFFLPEKNITFDWDAATGRSDLNPALLRTQWECSSESEDSDATLAL